MKTCACGCGTEIPEADARGRTRTYAGGHGNKGKSNTWKINPDSRRIRTGRARARKAVRIDQCELRAIGGCSASRRLDVHHRDKDPLNNDPGNLMVVCRPHHLLLDRGRIDEAHPVMPPFRVGSDGKRRYL